MKYSMLAYLLFVVSISQSQTLYLPQGISGIGNSTSENVGIGTSNPMEKLHIHNGKILIKSGSNINETTHSAGLRFVSDADSRAAEILIRRGANSFQTGLQFNTFSGVNIETMSLLNGKVGIGISNPASLLHVNGGGKIGSVINSPGYQDHFTVLSDGNVPFEGGQIFTNNDDVNGYGFKFSTAFSDTNNPFFRVGVVSQSSPNTFIQDYLFMKNGNVGVGTINPDSKLTVAGNIHSREVRVTVNAGADFVFEPDYNLRSLEETLVFVKDNKHLPEIPSEKKMIEDGLELGEMNIKLLQKVEELTLYLIDQNEVNKTQAKEIAELKEIVHQLLKSDE